MCPEANFLPQIIGILIGIICVTIIVGGFIIKRRYSNNEVRRFEKHAKRETEEKKLVEKREEPSKLEFVETEKPRDILKEEKEAIYLPSKKK